MLLDGRYEVVRPLAVGAQGRVVLAQDQRHDRRVVIKSRPADEAALAEARALYRLRPHPSIPLLRDDFTEDGEVHLVMDWIKGTDLADHVDRHSLPRLAEVAEWLGPVADALDHLHAHVPPVMHGDVKPANIVRAENGATVLVDLGAVGRPAIGTSGYRAPETASRPPAPPADIYALAVTVYVLLTGSLPKPGRFDHMPTVSPADVARVRRVLEWGMQLDPDSRPPSARSLVDALAGITAAVGLPSFPTQFFGRAHELALLDEQIRARRLVTVVGPPGSGKTRLAAEAARYLGAAFGGVLFVELTGLASGVADHVLGHLDTARGGGDPLALLTGALTRETRFLVLDGAETMLDEVAEVAGAIARQCPLVRTVVTSTTPLSVAGERVVRTGGFATDAPSGNEAARFLLDRLQETSGREHQPDDFAAAAAIASAVDGLPLALELAAARAKETDLPTVAAAIRQDLAALGVMRGAAPHHRTLATLVDRALDLLPSDVVHVLRAAAVLPGGIDTDVLAAVAKIPPDQARRALERAQAASMVERGDDRWRMLAPMRERLLEHLEGDTGVATRRDFAQWAQALAHEAAGRMRGRTDRELLSRLELEERNVLAGLGTALADDPLAVDGLAAYWDQALRRGHGIAVLEQARRARRDAGGDLPARSLAVMARLMIGDLQVEAGCALATEALAGASDDPAAAVEALLARGMGNIVRSIADVAPDLDRAEALLPATADAVLEARLHVLRAQVAVAVGRHDVAVARVDDAVLAAITHGLDLISAHALATLAHAEAAAGNFASAVDAADRLIAVATSAALAWRGEAWVTRGLVHGSMGELEAAERCLNEARRIWSETEDPRALDIAGFNLAVVDLHRGELVRAEALLAEVERAASRRGNYDVAANAAVVRGEVARREDRMEDARCHLVAAVLVLRRVGNPAKLATALQTLAEVSLALGDEELVREAGVEAAELFVACGQESAADAVRALIGSVPAVESH